MKQTLNLPSLARAATARQTVAGPPRRLTTILTGLLLTAALGAQAAAPALNARVYSRPLTPTDKTLYAMPTAEISGGLSTIGVGTAAYLEAHVNSAVAATNILNVTWALTSKPIGSAAALTNSPLGPKVPIYTPADALAYQLVGTRTLLRPDMEGQYTVTATITTATYGTTNVALTITAAHKYLGWSQGCILCHSGSLVAPNKSMWTNTLHATKFSRSIDGLVGSYSTGCISCHTVGYDTTPTAVNGGFDDIMTQTGWKFPTVLTNGNWASMQTNYPALANVANIQCENCHGPGSAHFVNAGDTNQIAVNWDVGNCGQCHDAYSHHIKVPEWKNSMHAITTTDPSGPGRESCVGCHTGIGFAQRGAASTNTTYIPITCAGCHDPHDNSKPHQLRNVGPVLLADGSTVAGYGTGELCMNCHHARTSATNVVATFSQTGGRFGPHHGPQTDLFMGVNGYTYGKNIPSSAHRDAIGDACVTCHMQPTPAVSDPAFLLTGGHTFAVKAVTSTNTIEMTTACAQCHGPIDSFDMVREDFNGDGVVEGVQTEVQHLMDQVSRLLPPDTSIKSSISPAKTWTQSQLAAAWNWSFVSEDRSHGVHNAAYAVGLLKASITDLTGDPAGIGPKTDSDFAFYAWQVKNFGSATSPNADPNAAPAGDGIPNWLKYSSGLNPWVKGTPGADGGMVWTSGSALGGNTPTNTILIYKAAEITFNTQPNTSYVVQACSSISDGWQNVSTNIPGTGTAISFLTPTRNNVQQFFRVVHNP